MGAVGELIRLARHLDEKGDEVANFDPSSEWNGAYARGCRYGAQQARLAALRYEADIDRVEEPRYFLDAFEGSLYIIAEEFAEAWLDWVEGCPGYPEIPEYAVKIEQHQEWSRGLARFRALTFAAPRLI